MAWMTTPCHTAMRAATICRTPYNRTPAKIFMGDTGATFLGYILATVSVAGLFKLYAIISFIVPFPPGRRRSPPSPCSPSAAQ